MKKVLLIVSIVFTVSSGASAAVCERFLNNCPSFHGNTSQFSLKTQSTIYWFETVKFAPLNNTNEASIEFNLTYQNGKTENYNFLMRFDQDGKFDLLTDKKKIGAGSCVYKTCTYSYVADGAQASGRFSFVDGGLSRLEGKIDSYGRVTVIQQSLELVK